MEVWKEIPGYASYEASDMGRIRSKRTGRLLSASPNNKGYLLTTLSVDCSPYRALVHRLIMLAFVGPSILQTNHKNGDKRDNRLANLEYCTARENVCHAKNVLGIAYGGKRRQLSEAGIQPIL